MSAGTVLPVSRGRCPALAGAAAVALAACSGVPMRTADGYNELWSGRAFEAMRQSS